MIIGLAGKKQCGKSTVAQFLCEGLNFKEDSFGAPIRQFVAELCGYTLDELEEKKEFRHEVFGVTPRYMMQTLGTQWARQTIKQTIWVDCLTHRINNDPRGQIVISDIRFENEATAIREMGGTIIHIVRPEANKEEDAHESENGIVVGDLDYVLVNVASINTMLEDVALILKRVEYDHGN